MEARRLQARPLRRRQLCGETIVDHAVGHAIVVVGKELDGVRPAHIHDVAPHHRGAIAIEQLAPMRVRVFDVRRALEDRRVDLLGARRVAPGSMTSPCRRCSRARRAGRAPAPQRRALPPGRASTGIRDASGVRPGSATADSRRCASRSARRSAHRRRGTAAPSRPAPTPARRARRWVGSPRRRSRVPKVRSWYARVGPSSNFIELRYHSAYGFSRQVARRSRPRR